MLKFSITWSPLFAGKPQSHTGPRLRPNLLTPIATRRATGRIRTRSPAAMTAGDTVPLVRMPAESTSPWPVTRWEATRCPSSCSVIASNSGRNQIAPKPRAARASVSQPMPTSMVRGDSWAWLDSAPRGSAKKVMAKAFTKQAAPVPRSTPASSQPAETGFASSR